ncbi:MAG TPA: LysE family transporter [Bryobacteraceae bacterium]|jgi:threonine/homoserine/homoserine lactone efflux protein|nr:LysE family transporter [Bryobacteraceae bacterium]
MHDEEDSQLPSMGAIELLLRGAAAGVAISAPVGPVNVLCASRTLSKGWFSGLISGLGAAAADTFYGAIAGFSISIVISFLIRQQSKLRFFGGILLILLGIWYYFKRPAPLSKDGEGEATHSDFVTTFLLNLTNPTTVLSFLAVLAVLGLSEQRDAPLTLIMIGGIFAGAMIWWIILISVINSFRDKFNDRSMFWMNRIGGLAIGAFGIVMLVLGISGKK